MKKLQKFTTNKITGIRLFVNQKTALESTYIKGEFVSLFLFC